MDAKQNGCVLTAEEVERFVRDGFVYLPEAFPRALADECRAFLWRETGLDPDDPATWTRPLIRLRGYGGVLFNLPLSPPVACVLAASPAPDAAARVLGLGRIDEDEYSAHEAPDIRQ